LEPDKAPSLEVGEAVKPDIVHSPSPETPEVRMEEIVPEDSPAGPDPASPKTTRGGKAVAGPLRKSARLRNRQKASGIAAQTFPTEIVGGRSTGGYDPDSDDILKDPRFSWKVLMSDATRRTLREKMKRDRLNLATLD
jgi:hypothetical protein